MSRAQKESEVTELQQRFEQGEAVIVTHNLGLTVAEVTELRSKLRAGGASFKTTKNTLARRALKGTRYEQIAKMFTGPTGVATSTDPVAAAKVTQEFAKDHAKLVILGGAMGDKVLSAAEVEQLSKLPSLDELRGRLVGLLVAPATKIARVLQTPAQLMVGVTKAQGEKG
ncbi:MAG: 50S ribosomal protein L10 [Alphaproteobacteria bacterium]|nr:50S ribosomal protein L10 [Alphaproteobacteria bacterium]